MLGNLDKASRYVKGLIFSSSLSCASVSMLIVNDEQYSNNDGHVIDSPLRA